MSDTKATTAQVQKAQPAASNKTEQKKAEPSISTEEKVYTIPLQGAWKAVFKKRAGKSISVIKAFAQKHLRADKVKIQNSLNELLWSNGTKWPPRQVQVKAIVHDGVA